ncbi:MAG: alpha/beta hydrolase [Nitrospirae bacterium]|nr:alpha/beta hydrolase [Nitrospirota bacterium]
MRKKKVIYAVLIGILLGYVVLVAFVFARQGSMLYFPERVISNTPKEIGLDYQELSFGTKDDVTISAWYIPAEHERGVLLFCHGNAGNISHRLDSIRIFHDLNLSILIFDYRGYGKSGGSPTEKGTYLDAEAAWDYLVKVLHVRPEKIILFGRSLGSAVAAELALRRKAGAVIMESGFTSIPDLGEKFFPHLPVRMISRYHYASGDKMSGISIPKLFIHSPQDELIPFEHALILFNKASHPKEFLEIRGSHNEGFLSSGSLYRDGLERFLSRYLSSL